jgi:hypothetical protein
MRVRQRLVRLERKFPAPPPPRPEDLARVQRWQQIAQRLMKMLEQALPLLDEGQQAQVMEGMAKFFDERDGPYKSWLQHVVDGWCRLPEVSPEAGQALLLAWLSPEVDGGTVCKHCGLEYPHHRKPPLSEWKVLPSKIPLQGPPPWYDLPEFFQACPSCGASRFEMDWPHLIQDKHNAWMECDGYMGLGR